MKFYFSYEASYNDIFGNFHEPETFEWFSASERKIKADIRRNGNKHVLRVVITGEENYFTSIPQANLSKLIFIVINFTCGRSGSFCLFFNILFLGGKILNKMIRIMTNYDHYFYKKM